MSRAKMMEKLGLSPADFGIKTEQERYTELVQEYMDNIARSRGYDDVFTCISYVNSTDAVFKAEAEAMLQWRDRIWRICYQILADIEQGKRAVPTEQELLAELPRLEW